MRRPVLLSLLFAATIALVQVDIKRVMAYSTVSQLGYMFLALGVGAPIAAIFHLATHAFFKALLFLGSGSVIHGLGGEQDMRKMGGLRRKLPVTYWTMLLAGGALAALPPESIKLTKRLMKERYAATLSEVIDEEVRIFTARLSSPEAKEAMSAFLEKRKPDFSRFS